MVDLEELEGIDDNKFPYIHIRCRRFFTPQYNPKKTIRDGKCDMDFKIRRVLHGNTKNTENIAYMIEGKLVHR